jgi:hypothetical protein
LSARDPAQLYLDLLKGVLTRLLFTDEPEGDNGFRAVAGGAETMVTWPRLDSLDRAIASVLADGVPGDLIETGVWRGGMTIFMRAALEARGDLERRVWVADSFAGMPAGDRAAFPEDVGTPLAPGSLAVSQEEVEENFRRYGLLDDRVTFLPGPFRDTLADAPIERLAVLRMDGDLYESTFVALESLYDKVSPGGFVLVDDYQTWPQCRLAVDDFRSDRGLTEPIEFTDDHEAWWRKAR